MISKISRRPDKSGLLEMTIFKGLKASCQEFQEKEERGIIKCYVPRIPMLFGGLAGLRILILFD